VIRPGGWFRAHPGGKGGSGGYFCVPTCKFFRLPKDGNRLFHTWDSKIPYQLGVWTGTGGVVEQKKKAVNHSCYPDEVIERLARCFYPAILESFNNEEDQKAFAAWQAEQARCSAKEKQDVPDGERPAIHTQLFSSWVRLSGRTFLLMCAFLNSCLLVFAYWISTLHTTSGF